MARGTNIRLEKQTVRAGSITRGPRSLAYMPLAHAYRPLPWLSLHSDPAIGVPAATLCRCRSGSRSLLPLLLRNTASRSRSQRPRTASTCVAVAEQDAVQPLCSHERRRGSDAIRDATVDETCHQSSGSSALIFVSPSRHLLFISRSASICVREAISRAFLVFDLGRPALVPDMGGGQAHAARFTL